MLDDMYQQILDRLDRIDERLDNLDVRYVSRDLVDEKFKRQGERLGSIGGQVDKLEEDRKWLNRIVLGSVLTSVLAIATEGPIIGG